MLMKRMVAASVFALVAAQVGFGQNQLTNPGLDSPPDHETDIATGWTLIEPDVDAAGMPVNSATFASFANHTPGGTRGLWYRSFEGGLGGDEPATVDAHLQQDVPGTPGTNYTLSAWYRYETFYSGTDSFADTQTNLAIDFLGAGDVLLSSSVLDVDAVQLPDGTWREFSVSGIAPAGTVEVRARSSMLDGILEPSNPQSAFVDDFTLVPEPGTIVCLIPALALLMRRR
jgi:hypothetical protein